MSKGTFTAADQTSGKFAINTSANLSLVFGDGTVKLQRYMNDDWRDVPDGEWSASTEDIVYSGSPRTLHRLICSSYTSDIEYELG